MKKYEAVEVTEKQLEDLIRQGAALIEEGLRYIDHQRMTDRGPLDVLMVDSGNALVVAELKVVEDDSILVQGIDYYDYVSRNVEGLSRIYKQFNIQPRQAPRLFLIAPSFSVSLLNRCKWIDIPISLFTFKCIKFEDSKDVIPVFSEVTIPSTPEVAEKVTVEDHLNYITYPEVRQTAEGLLKEIKEWDKDNILIEATKYDISMKIHGRVFGYLSPRRSFFTIWTYGSENKWVSYRITDEKDLLNAKALLKTNMEELKSGR